jgi:type IV pilus modification protein PilV
MVCSNKRLPQQSGFTLLEVIIALFVFAIGILGVAAMQVRAIQGNSSGMRLTEATNQAQTFLETILAAPFASLACPSDPPATTVGQYTIDPVITEINPLAMSCADAMLITVNVSWTEASGITRNTRVSYIKSSNLETSYESL